jgi:hypothetical protein
MVSCTSEYKTSESTTKPIEAEIQNNIILPTTTINKTTNNEIILEPDGLSLNLININFVSFVNDLIGAPIEDMMEEYGLIVENEWVSGQRYRHEKLDVWVGYYDRREVIDINKASIVVRIDDDDIYSIFQNEKVSSVICNLSDLFLKEQFLLEDFTSFSEIYDSLEWDAYGIYFFYDNLRFSFLTNMDNSITKDTKVTISKVDK